MAKELVAIFPLLINFTYASPQCGVKGECTSSHLNGISIVANAKECLKQCQEEPDCEWYTYNPDGQICEFLEDCYEINDESCPNCVSGESSCPLYQCNVQGLCIHGYIIHSLTTDTMDECLMNCKNHPSRMCYWFSYAKESQTCLLFNTCPTLDENEADFISGEYKCNEEK